MLFDSHSHTEFSADSEMKAEDAIAAAQKQGIGLVFTEHLDIDYPGELDFTFNPDAYWNAYEPYRSDTLRLGVEVGMQESTRLRSKDFTKLAPFDEVIGAQHMVHGKDIYYAETFAGYDKASFYHDYFADMAANVRSHDFIDVLAHIDYIARYAPYENPEIEYKVFHDEIDDVLKAVLERGVVLELNTRRIGEQRALDELRPVFARYKEMGGAYITIGSDAHTADAIGAHFDVAWDFAQALDLEVVTFVKRKMQRLTK